MAKSISSLCPSSTQAPLWQLIANRCSRMLDVPIREPFAVAAVAAVAAVVAVAAAAAVAAVAAVTAGAEEIPTEKVPESTLGILHARTRGVRFDIPVGATALDIAEMRGHSEVAQLLRKPSD